MLLLSLGVFAVALIVAAVSLANATGQRGSILTIPRPKWTKFGNMFRILYLFNFDQFDSELIHPFPFLPFSVWMAIEWRPRRWRLRL